MPLFLLLLTSSLAGAAGWDEMLRIPPDGKIEITLRDGTRARATFVSAAGEAILVRDQSGERSIERGALRQVRIEDPSRRVRNGLLGLLIGAGAGVAIGVAVCPGCAGEGVPGKYVAPGVAAGAALGALRFLPAPYRTIYKSK